MIVAFFLFYYYSVSAWKWFVKGNHCNRLLDVTTPDEAETGLAEDVNPLPAYEGSAFLDEEKGLRFVPPVYAQRYATVMEVLKTVAAEGYPVRKVVDFGCSEMAFFQFLKTMSEIEEIVLVDVDNDVLQNFNCRIHPSTSDYLSKRRSPLNVRVLRGSVSNWDSRLRGTNAVVAIELIEHLYPETLEQLPYSIFGLIQPEVALFTTPNADFNVLFPNFTGFRHDDHKFEWSRQQFEDWANNLTLRYPDYKVAFHGIGHGPEGSEQYGCCSQIAVFNRKTNTVPKFSAELKDEETYHLILEVDYPVFYDPRSKEEIIRDDADNFIKSWHTKEEYSVNDRIEVPFKDIMRYVPDCTSSSMLRDVLSSAGWKVEQVADEDFAVVLPYWGLYSSSSSEMSEGENANCQDSWVENGEEENWNTSSDGINRADELNHKVEENSSVNPPDISQSEQEISGQASTADANGIVQCFDDYRPSSTSQEIQNTKIVRTSVVRRTECNGSSSFARCQSLEPINQNENKNFRYSLCCDPVESSVCDIVCAKTVVFSKEKEGSSEEIVSGCSDAIALRLEDSCSQSKAGDSGYPNSSERDMDMDLTPEQVDEIVTESESSFEEGDDESVQGEEPRIPAAPPPPPLPPIHWVDNMENGDVANNNRDWEGNNMEAAEAQIGEALQFEHLIIDHRDFVVPLMDAAAEDCDSDEDNRYVSASEFLNTSDDTIVASDDSFNMTLNPQNETLFYDPDGRMDGASVAPPPDVQARHVQFPAWLLNILLEESEQEDDDLGAGDFDNVEQHDDEHQEGDDEEEEEVVTVEGDVLGGGEPSHTD